MTAPDRQTAGEKSVRSANVAHFLPPDWGRIAELMAPALERVPRDLGSCGVLVVVPDAGATVSLARALAPLPAAAGHRVVAVTSASRGKRLLAGAPATIIIGAPQALAALLASSALKLADVSSLVLAAADDLDADDAELGALLTEVPKGASRLLTALAATPGVELLLERHLHRARRVTSDVAPAEGSATTPVLRFVSVGGSPLEALPALLDEADAPSATIVLSDEARRGEVATLLASLGYEAGPLATISSGEVEPNTALVVFLGVPTATQWNTALSAAPAQLVAIVTPRDRAALELLSAPAPVRPFVVRATVAKARAAEARARAELRDVLSEGIPAREILALESLLVEHDGLEVAAAALRLLDRTRSSQNELVREAERRVRAEAAATGPTASTAPRVREDRPRSDRPREDRPREGRPRDDRPRDDRPRGDRPPRTFGSKADRPPRDYAPRTDRAPRDFAPRGDRPPRDFPPRGDRPRGPKRDDKPRGPRGPR